MKDKRVLEVGQRIARIRKSHGLNQSEFADKIGATVPAVSNWENGRNMPNDARLKAIADLDGLSVVELLNGKSDENTNSKNTNSPEKLKSEISKLHDIVRGYELGLYGVDVVIERTKKASDSIVSEYNSLFPDATIQ